MSVYTRVSRPELEAFLALYDVGELRYFEGITAGIENTNYFVTTTGGEFVLTLFEQHTAKELPWFLQLMDHLAQAGIPSAAPVADRDAVFLRELCERPAALVHKLRGGHVADPSLPQCAAMGTVMAKMHLAGVDYSPARAEDRGSHWMAQTLPRLNAKLGSATAERLAAAVTEQASLDMSGLPCGVIHADLFHDNALFVEEQVSGVIDFYYACTGPFLYDLAVTANDWCTDKIGAIQPLKLNALLNAYAVVRPFTAAERELWPLMLKRAALRFWLSRLCDKLFPREGELVLIKDPGVFERIFEAHLANPQKLMAYAALD